MHVYINLCTSYICARERMDMCLCVKTNQSRKISHHLQTIHGQRYQNHPQPKCSDLINSKIHLNLHCIRSSDEIASTGNQRNCLPFFYIIECGNYPSHIYVEKQILFWKENTSGFKADKDGFTLLLVGNALWVESKCSRIIQKYHNQ